MQMHNYFNDTLLLRISTSCILCATALMELAAAMLVHVSDAATSAVHVRCFLSDDSNSVETASCK